MKKPGPLCCWRLLAAVFAGGVLYLFNRQFAGGGDVYPAYSTLRADPGWGQADLRKSAPAARHVGDPQLPAPGSLAGSQQHSPAARIAAASFATQPDPRCTRSRNSRNAAIAWSLRMGEAVDARRRGRPARKAVGRPLRPGLRQRGPRHSVFRRSARTGTFSRERDAAAGRREGFREGQHRAGRGWPHLRQPIGGRSAANRVAGPHHRQPHARIVFDESHFGIVESGSIVALARRFRLHGLALGLAICRAAIHLEECLQLPARGRGAAQSKGSPAAHRWPAWSRFCGGTSRPTRLAAAAGRNG